MPDILIRGLEMPKGCKSCKLSSDDHCNATGQWLFSTDLLRSGFNWKTCRLPDCPLRELPSHGDLVDRDEIIEQIAETPFTMSMFQTVKECRAAINAKEVIHNVVANAPTIVPANKERSEGA